MPKCSSCTHPGPMLNVPHHLHLPPQASRQLWPPNPSPFAVAISGDSWAIAGHYQCQNNGKDERNLVVPFPALQNDRNPAARSRHPFPKVTGVAPNFQVPITPMWSSWSPFVVQCRHGDRGWFLVPDEVALASPNCRHETFTATSTVSISDWLVLEGKLQKNGKLASTGVFW